VHSSAYFFIMRYSTLDSLSIVEIGSKNINGSVRNLFPNAKYWGIDIAPGKDVDEVADGTVWQPKDKVDLVICCEVLEHLVEWRKLIINAYTMLKDGGIFLGTAAGIGRKQHSAIDGLRLRPNEYYGNISREDLTLALAGFSDISIECNSEDIYWKAYK